MLGNIFDLFTRPHAKDILIRDLQLENARLRFEKEDLEQRLTVALTRPTYSPVAKDFGIGPKLYASIVDKFYDKMEAILSDAAFSMLMQVRFDRPCAHHSVAMVDSTKSLRVTAHEFHVPEFNCRIKTMESPPYE